MKKIDVMSAIGTTVVVALKVAKAWKLTEAAVDSRDYKRELIGDIRRMTVDTLKCLPSTGTKYHVFDKDLPGKDTAYLDITIEKVSGRAGVYGMRHIRVGLSSFRTVPDVAPGEKYRPGVGFRWERVSKPVVDVDVRAASIVGVRFDGNQHRPGMALEDMSICELKLLKRIMLAGLDFQKMGVVYHHGHPMATVK